ncbi:MAG TPA: Spx/MgsR family RNA polymerase-binding regulatory protein [Bacilli bacterium]
MKVKIYQNPRCTSCRKAVKWLSDHQIEAEKIPIIEQPPNINELKQIIANSGLDVAKLFHKSGAAYRAFPKDKLREMTEEEQIALLAADGNLLRRPIITGDGKATVGFNEIEYAKTWGA